MTFLLLSEVVSDGQMGVFIRHNLRISGVQVTSILVIALPESAAFEHLGLPSIYSRQQKKVYACIKTKNKKGRIEEK